MKSFRSQLTRLSLLGLLASLLVVASPIENASASLVNVSGTVTLPDGTPVDHLSLVFAPTGLQALTTVTVDPATGNFTFQASPGSGLLWMATGGYGNHCATLSVGDQVIQRALSSVLPACFRSFADIVIRSDSTVSLGFGNNYPSSSVPIIMPQTAALHFQVIDAATSAPIPYAQLANAITGEVVSVAPNRQNGSTAYPNGSNVLPAPTWIPFGGLNYSDTGSVTTDANGEITIRGFVGDYFAIGAYNHQSLNFVGIDPTNSNRTESVSLDSISADQSFTLALPPVEHVSGRITTTSGLPVGNALFSYVPTGSPDSVDHLIQTDADGRFAFDASPGNGTVNFFNGIACNVYRKTDSPAPTLDIPACSHIDFPVTITSGDAISITGSNVGPFDASDWGITLPNLINVEVDASNAADQSPIPGAILQANNMWGYTDVTILGTTQHIIWQMPQTTVTANGQGQATFPAWSGPVAGYPNTTNFEGSFPMVLAVADPNNVARNESVTVTSFTSIPTTIQVGQTAHYSGTISVDTGTAVGNIAVVYAAGASVNAVGGYSLNGSATFNNFRFTSSSITDAQGHFTFSATPGEGGLFLFSGSNSKVQCTPSTIGGNNLTAQDIATVDLPACMVAMRHVRIESDGSVTDLSTNTNFASDSVNLTLPHTAKLTFRVVDEITGETLTGVPVQTQGYEFGTLQNASNREQRYITHPWGSTPLMTDSNGELTVPINSGLWDGCPTFVAYDSSNSARNATTGFLCGFDSDRTFVLALPDPPLPPETATATIDSGNDNSATIDWTLPTNDGGLPITDYVVTAEQDNTSTALRAAPPIKFTIRASIGHGASVISTAPTITHTLNVNSLTHLSDTISGLTSGITYRFSIKAVNSLGQSLPRVAYKNVTTSTNRSGGGGNSGGGGVPMMAPPLSSDTSLKVFTINGSPTSGTSFDLPVGTTSVVVLAVPTDSGAKATISGGAGLVAGVNTVTVTVTAADGTKKSYSVTVNVAAPVVVDPLPVALPVPITVALPPTESVAPNTPAQPSIPAPVTVISAPVASKATVSKAASIAAKAPSVNTIAGQKVDLTVASLPKSTSFVATVLVNGKQVKLGTIKSGVNGSLVIQGFNQKKPGTYTIALTSSKGVKYFIKVVVKAAKK